MPTSSTIDPVTITDIIKPVNASGYKWVRSASAGPNGGGQTELWKAELTKNGKRTWRSPYFRQPGYAAMALLDYLNGREYDPAPVKKTTAAHAVDRVVVERDEEEEAALGVLRDKRAQRAGRQGYIYCITDGEYAKIGYSVNPSKRVTELQTGNARVLAIFGTIPGTLEDERRLHEKHIEKNVLQEWFELDSDLLAEFMEEEPNA